MRTNVGHGCNALDVVPRWRGRLKRRLVDLDARRKRRKERKPGEVTVVAPAAAPSVHATGIATTNVAPPPGVSMTLSVPPWRFVTIS